jgi:hypothetical protein
VSGVVACSVNKSRRINAEGDDHENPLLLKQAVVYKNNAFRALASVCLEGRSPGCCVLPALCLPASWCLASGWPT